MGRIYAMRKRCEAASLVGKWREPVLGVVGDRTDAMMKDRDSENTDEQVHVVPQGDYLYTYSSLQRCTKPPNGSH